MFKGEAIECLKCKNRFLDTRQEWEEIEKNFVYTVIIRIQKKQ